MKKVIEYHDVPHGGHLLATPEFSKSEIVEAESEEKIDEYITSQSDRHGCDFRKNEKFGDENSVSSKYKYISNQGGVIVKDYEEPEIKKID